MFCRVTESAWIKYIAEGPMELNIDNLLGH